MAKLLITHADRHDIGIGTAVVAPARISGYEVPAVRAVRAVLRT